MTARAKSPDKLGLRIVLLLTVEGALTVAALQKRLGVRRQRLFPVLAALECSGRIASGLEPRQAADGKRRRLRVYSLAVSAAEPSSQAVELGSLLQDRETGRAMAHTQRWNP